MDLSPHRLHAAARRADALAGDLEAVGWRLRAATTSGFGTAAGEAADLLNAAASTLAAVGADLEEQVDGLLLTARFVADVDQEVAAALSRLGR